MWEATCSRVIPSSESVMTKGEVIAAGVLATLSVTCFEGPQQVDAAQVRSLAGQSSAQLSASLALSSPGSWGGKKTPHNNKVIDLFCRNADNGPNVPRWTRAGSSSNEYLHCGKIPWLFQPFSYSPIDCGTFCQDEKWRWVTDYVASRQPMKYYRMWAEAIILSPASCQTWNSWTAKTPSTWLSSLRWMSSSWMWVGTVWRRIMADSCTVEW